MEEYGANLVGDIGDLLRNFASATLGYITTPFKALYSRLVGSKYTDELVDNEGHAIDDSFHSVTQLIGDLFYGIADITDISWTANGLKVTYISGYQFDEDNYKNYLMNYYFMYMPEFHSYIGGLTDDALEQKKEMLYKDIVANEGLFRDIFLRNTETASEEYTETCTGAIDSALVSELGKPVNIADGVTVNFDTNYSFGIVNGKNHNGVDLNETTAGVKAGDSVYSVAKGKV